MLHSCAEYLTHTLYRHCPLSEEKRPVFVYGFELSLSTLSSILSIILLSIIFKNVYSSLLFLYTFFFLRLFSGGYHAPTYSKCFILTNAIFAFVYLLSEVIQWYKPLLIPFAILSCISIFLLSPIRSTKHPLSERLYAQNKKTARIIVSIDFLLFLILYITGMPTRYLATWALSLSAVAIMMVITLFEKNLREYYPELYNKDSVISVSDEIAEMMRRSILEEKAYQRRLCRYQAYYSLDYALTAENKRDLLDDEVPEDLQEQKERRRKLQKAFRTLTPSQQRRIYKRYFLCMSYIEISQSEGCTISAVCNSIHRSLKKLKKNYDL